MTRQLSTFGNLTASISRVVQRDDQPAEMATAVADVLRPFLSTSDLLSTEQCAGDAEHYRQHVLHVSPGGDFSLVALVWLPGQQTPVHDHVSWCVTGVYQGMEHEQRYEQRADELVPTTATTNHPGDVCGFAPPGDIHRVYNAGQTKAISIHVYGADIGQLGSSVRRSYDLPIRA